MSSSPPRLPPSFIYPERGGITRIWLPAPTPAQRGALNAPPGHTGEVTLRVKSQEHQAGFNQATVEAAGLDRKENPQVHHDTDDLLSFMSSARQILEA